ncbi:hypothetical protein ACFXTH_038641 [Malus domestica]
MTFSRPNTARSSSLCAPTPSRESFAGTQLPPTSISRSAQESRTPPSPPFKCLQVQPPFDRSFAVELLFRNWVTEFGCQLQESGGDRPVKRH